MTLPAELLDILACPACHSDLVEKPDALICTNAECRRLYKVRDDIPIFVIEESETLDQDKWQAQVNPA